MTRHSESRILPYSPQQMFDLVADVGRYPEFLPWCAAARVRRLDETPYGQVMEADLVVSFRVFRERFGSRVELRGEEDKIVTEYIDGPFRYLRSVWEFRPADEGCEVAFQVDFEFKNMILQRAIGLVFNQAMQRIVRAFEARAKALHG
ncbi:MAG: type II toxin-antitoxin system RatA family toxin [Pseudomonadota bacterium]